MNSYKEVCCALGILEDNEEWDKVLADALSSLTGKRARQLFAVMLIFCEIPHPYQLF